MTVNYGALLYDLTYFLKPSVYIYCGPSLFLYDILPLFYPPSLTNLPSLFDILPLISLPL